LKLQYKIALFISVMLIFVVSGIGFMTFSNLERTIETQMGNNAMDLAVTVASLPDVEKTLVEQGDYMAVQNLVEKFRKQTRFQYVIVMDMNGIQYSYPSENLLGKRYKNGGEERILSTGEAYVSADRNVLISAIRAFAPVYSDGKQVGAVLVGILTDTVYKEIGTQIRNLELTLVVWLLAGILGAAFLAVNIKRTIFGLEPKEIALLLGQRDIILQSLNNGVLAIDKDGQILLFNKLAKEILGLSQEDIGRPLSDYSDVYSEQMLRTLKSKETILNQEIRLSPGKTILCSHTPLRDHRNEFIGVVSNIQDLTQVKLMAEELTGYEKLTNALRAQNHEFMNKLHTISGLIQLDASDEAVDYIAAISEQRERMSGIINNRIENSHVSAILLAKYNRAAEAKILLEIDSASYLNRLPTKLTEDELCSILGNLIENAIEELVQIEDGEIFVRLTSGDEELEVIVSDNGPGIREDLAERIFERGVTSKSGSRGLGLSIVKEIIDEADGKIELDNEHGACWRVTIPYEGGRALDYD
jgi:two-component system CitB family sensor kinase